MASVYGSSPDDHPALQSRILGADLSPGSIWRRK
jgi:hypothetical protein